MPTRDPRASFSLSPLAQEVLASYINAESTKFKNFTKFYEAFEKKVRPFLGSKEKFLNYWTLSRWKDVGRQSAISADSLLQLSLYRDETEAATRLWLDGGDPQGSFADRFVIACRSEPMTRQDAAEILTTIAYRLSLGNLDDDLTEQDRSGEVSAIAPQSLLTLKFTHEWYPVLVRAAAHFGEPQKANPDEFYREHQINPELVVSLLARQDLVITEGDLLILIEAISQDEPGLTATELLLLFRGQSE